MHTSWTSFTLPHISACGYIHFFYGSFLLIQGHYVLLPTVLFSTVISVRVALNFHQPVDFLLTGQTDLQFYKQVDVVYAIVLHFGKTGL